MADQDYGGGEGGKRAAEDQRQNQNKRPRGDYNQVVFRLLIRSFNAGGVIGKGGENIKRLRTDYDAKVSIPDCNGPERIIKIVTKNLDSGLDCIKDIISSVSEKKQDQNNQNNQNNRYVRILVHQSHAGAIIGRAGFKIKELREKTGAHFKVFTDTCPKSTDRVVQLTGNPDVIVKAAREVYEICSDTPVKGPVQEYDPFCYETAFFDKYGGYLFDPDEESGEGGGYGGSGRGGGGGQWNRGPPFGGHGGHGGHGGRGGYDRGMGGGNDSYGYGRSPYGGGGGGHGGGGGGGMGMRGGRGGRGRGRGGGGGMGGRGGYGGGQAYGDQGYDNYGGSSGRGPSSYGRSEGGGGGGGSGGFGGGSGGGESIQTQQVTIPNDLAGSIIGRGGSRIKEIRMQSGAQIKIDDPLQGAKDRVITMTGTQHTIDYAKFLLQKSVREYQGMRGGNH